MRQSNATALSALNGVTENFTLLTGDTIAVTWSGTGIMTHSLEYLLEGVSGTPWVQVYNPAFAAVSNTVMHGTLVVPDLPRGVYRVRCSAFTSGTRTIQLLAY